RRGDGAGDGGRRGRRVRAVPASDFALTAPPELEVRKRPDTRAAPTQDDGSRQQVAFAMPSTRFQLVALPATNFEPLFALDAAALADRHIQRLRADEGGHLCRVTLADVAIGGDLLLLSYQHHGAASPYRAAGPI